jgi:hypothetical protein
MPQSHRSEEGRFDLLLPEAGGSLRRRDPLLPYTLGQLTSMLYLYVRATSPSSVRLTFFVSPEGMKTTVET